MRNPLIEHKRLTLFAGHYGSGKTNIAVNYAMHLAAEGKKVCIADLDIVNPYFRTKDSAKVLEKAEKNFNDEKLSRRAMAEGMDPFEVYNTYGRF